MNDVMSPLCKFFKAALQDALGWLCWLVVFIVVGAVLPRIFRSC